MIMDQTVKTEEEPTQYVKLVFMYTDKGTGGKPIYLWMNLVDYSIRYYRGPHNRNIITAKPGMIFQFAENANGDIYSNRWKLLDEKYPDQSEVMTWAAKEKAYSLRKAEKAKLAKGLKEDSLTRHIEALSIAYHSLAGVSREQFLAYIVGRIVKGV